MSLLIYFQNISGETALHSAAQYGHVAVVDVLLQVRSIENEVFVWFDFLHPINNLSVKQGRVFLGWTSIKLG